MNNFFSSFGLYEILRIVIPGFYSTLMISDFIIKHKIHEIESWDYLLKTVAFFIASIFIGGLIYAPDVPRWFKGWYGTLPSKLIREDNPGEEPKKRHHENEYYKFYYKHNSDAKYKTEMQSGFLHFFINMGFVSLIGLVFYSIVCYFFDTKNIFFIINLLVAPSSILAAIIIYHQRLKYSWRRNYEEYNESLKPDENSTKKK